MFLEEIDRTSNVIKSLIKKKRVRIFSHYDADGLTSASIIAKMLLREGVNFKIRIIKQLLSEFIKELELDENDLVILTDFGSGQLSKLRKFLDKTIFLILDHHEPYEIEHPNLFHLNPLLFAEPPVSSSVICYLLAKSTNTKNTDLIDLAIVGAVADEHEESWEFKGLAKKILKEAEILGRISIMKGLRLYGRTVRPLHKSLAYSFDPYIPGISGSESNAVQLLSELKIPIKEDDEWRKLKDLTEEEQKKLAAAIIMERLKEKEERADDIFGDVYTLIGKPEELQNVREFGTLLNSCGRTDNPDIAIRLCLEDFSIVETAWEILDQYRRLISNSLNWIREGNIKTTEYASYILAGNKIPESLIGTITSIALNSDFVDTNKPIFGLADAGDYMKISARISRDLNLNLRDIIVKAVRALDGEGGGHTKAAGGLIPKKAEDKFVKTVDSLLGEMIASKKG